MPVEPTSGLGNFKGVMLCNRPADVEAERRVALESKGPPPFRSAISKTYNDPLGLTPPNAVAGPTDCLPKRLSAPTAALRKHTQWLKSFAEGVAAKRAQKEESVEKEEERLKRISEFAARQREDVRRVLEDTRKSCEADDGARKDDLADAEEGSADRDCMEQAISGKKKKSGKGPKERPVWSLTEAQAVEAAQVNEEELLAFAESVNFDEYINDLEFRTALAVMKVKRYVILQDRAGRLSREQESFRKSLQEAYDRELKEQQAGGEDE
ncbi:U3 snoRNP protein, partial [Perkinsus olseni]